MDIKISFKTLLIFVVLILSVYSVVLTYIIILGQMEVPSWLLQSTSYAIMTAILTGILVPSVLDYFKNRKLAKNKKKKELEKKLDNTKQFTTIIKNSLEERVKDSSLPESSNVNLLYAPSDLREKGEKYTEKYNLCVDLKTACKTVILLHLQKLTRKGLPKTCKESEYDLASALDANGLVQRYINKEDVTRIWIETTCPHMHSDIMKNLKDGERNLGHFFIELNSTFREDPVLERFRKEKANLTELGNNILKELTHKEKEAEKELEDFT